MILQLNPPIPLNTPKGPALAHLVIDNGPEYHLCWVCFLDESGECWTYENPQIRATKNITYGRTEISPIEEKLPQELLDKLCDRMNIPTEKLDNDKCPFGDSCPNESTTHQLIYHPQRFIAREGEKPDYTPNRINEKIPEELPERDLWKEFIINDSSGIPKCGLCRNNGRFYLTASVLSKPCICPNGRHLKKQEKL